MTTDPAVTVITGDGKGKTTAALGMAFSVFMGGGRVLVVQFLKGTGYTGELGTAAHLGDRFRIRQFGAGCMHSDDIRSGDKLCRRCGECFRENRKPENKYTAQALTFASTEAASGKWDLMMLDEISHSVNRAMIAGSEVQRLLDEHRDRMRFVLTGRNMPDVLRNLADQVTECAPLRHPMKQGILARRGIEY